DRIGGEQDLDGLPAPGRLGRGTGRRVTRRLARAHGRATINPRLLARRPALAPHDTAERPGGEQADGDDRRQHHTPEAGPPEALLVRFDVAQIMLVHAFPQPTGAPTARSISTTAS